MPGISADRPRTVVLLAIPFKTLSLSPNNTTWGINLERTIARVAEAIGWVSRVTRTRAGAASEAT